MFLHHPLLNRTIAAIAAIAAATCSQQLLPSVTHGWLIQEVTPEIIRQAQQCGLDMVCPRANALTADGVQQLVDQGFVVRAWGVKKLEVGLSSCLLARLGQHCWVHKLFPHCSSLLQLSSAVSVTFA